MPQIKDVGSLDTSLAGSELVPFQEAAGGASSTKRTTVQTIADVNDPEIFFNGGNSYRESFPRYVASTSSFSPTAGVMALTAIVLRAGDVVTNISAVSGGTALVLGSSPHLWFALYDTTKTLIGQSTDEGGSSAWTVSSIKTKALAGGPYTIATSGVHYIGIMMQAGGGGTQANIKGILSTTSMTGSILSGMAQLCGTNGSSLTTTAPTGPLTITDAVSLFWCCTS